MKIVIGLNAICQSLVLFSKINLQFSSKRFNKDRLDCILGTLFLKAFCFGQTLRKPTRQRERTAGRVCSTPSVFCFTQFEWVTTRFLGSICAVKYRDTVQILDVTHL